MKITKKLVSILIVSLFCQGTHPLFANDGSKSMFGHAWKSVWSDRGDLYKFAVIAFVSFAALTKIREILGFDKENEANPAPKKGPRENFLDQFRMAFAQDYEKLGKFFTKKDTKIESSVKLIGVFAGGFIDVKQRDFLNEQKAEWTRIFEDIAQKPAIVGKQLSKEVQATALHKFAVIEGRVEKFLERIYKENSALELPKYSDGQKEVLQRFSKELNGKFEELNGALITYLLDKNEENKRAVLEFIEQKIAAFVKAQEPAKTILGQERKKHLIDLIKSTLINYGSEVGNIANRGSGIKIYSQETKNNLRILGKNCGMILTFIEEGVYEDDPASLDDDTESTSNASEAGSAEQPAEDASGVTGCMAKPFNFEKFSQATSQPLPANLEVD